jgi:hypothetical protein
MQVANHSVRCFGSIRPEMEDDPNLLGRNPGNFLGLNLRHIENLNATGDDLDLVVMHDPTCS